MTSCGDEAHLLPARTSSKSTKRVAPDVDAYIASAPPQARAMLEELRRIVRECVPEAQEAISYAMPTYKFHGPLAGFAAFQKHVGFFGSLDDKERADFKEFKTSRGTIQFPYGKPLPTAKIMRLVRTRAKANAGTGKP